MAASGELAAGADPEAPQPMLTKTQIEAFLTKSIETMQSEEYREKLKEPTSGRPGVLLGELHKKVWEDMGIPEHQGRGHVTQLERYYPEDCESLVEMRNLFTKTAEATYLQCLADRRPPELEKEAKMPRETVLEFFNAANLRLDQEDFQEKLREAIRETGSLPEELVRQMHREVLELLGFEAEHGQACFGTLAEDYPEDREIAQTLQHWQRKASVSMLALLREYQKGGGEVKGDEMVDASLVELQAKEELDEMTPEDRSALLEKNAKKVQVFRSLPIEGRKRYLSKLSAEEKLELTKAEVLLVTAMQQRQQQQQYQAFAQQQAEQRAKAEAEAKVKADAEAAFQARKEKAAARRKKAGR